MWATLGILMGALEAGLHAATWKWKLTWPANRRYRLAQCHLCRNTWTGESTLPLISGHLQKADERVLWWPG